MLAGIVALMMSNVVAPGLVALLGALTLAATGVIDYADVSSGLGDPVILMIASLFVVSEALDITGVTSWAGQRLTNLARGRRTVTLVLVMSLCAALTSLISVNGAVAALVPMTVLVAIRVDEPSQMLMPLAFAAHAGSMLTLTGTPVNLIVNEQLAASGAGELRFVEFGLVGLPLLAGTILITCVLGPRVLPRGRANAQMRDLSLHGETLSRYYLDDDAAACRWTPNAPRRSLRATPSCWAAHGTNSNRASTRRRRSWWTNRSQCVGRRCRSDPAPRARSQCSPAWSCCW